MTRYGAVPNTARVSEPVAIMYTRVPSGDAATPNEPPRLCVTVATLDLDATSMAMNNWLLPTM